MSKTKVITSVINNYENDQRVQKVCQSLQKFGYDVEVIATNLRGEPELHFPYLIHILKLSSQEGMGMYMNFNWQLYQQLMKITTKDDILLANDLDALLPNYLVSKKKNCKLVFDSHEIFSEMPSLTERKIKKWLWKKLENRLMPKLKHIYTVSDSYAKWFEKEYNVKAEVIRNVPITQTFNDDKLIVQLPKRKPNEKVIIYQGAVNMSRGIDKMIQAMKYVEDAQLWIIGNGPKKQDYENLTKELELENKVKFLGNQKPTQLRLITPLADLGLSLEEDGGISYRYALPNKIFDYSHAGIPILGTFLPEIKNTIEKYGLGKTIENHDILHISNKITELLSEGKEAYAENLKKAAEIFNWENEEKKLIEIFDKVKN